MWKPAKILFNAELEALQIISDYRGWSSVAEIYINKQLKQKLLKDAIKSCIVVDRYFAKMYLKV